MELGIYSFVEHTPDPDTGRLEPAARRMRDVVEEVALADEVGLDVFGIGEHHRPDYLSAAPAVVLAAAATRTRRIRLTSAVTVLSSDDPVRVFQDFATLDLLSEGRAEIMVGRGSFTESFPLFGYDLRDYDALFDEKLRLLLQLREHEEVHWSGRHRPALHGARIHPRPVQQPLPVWVAVGGNPPSVVRAASLGLPMALAIIGGQPERFVPLAELYRDAARRAGHDPARLPISLNAHGWIAPASAEAAEASYPAAAQTMNRIGRERGWPPFTREQFEQQRGPDGAWFVGDPTEVADKILQHHAWFGHDRVLLQLTVGSMPHEEVLRAIELFGTEVAPRVREEVGRRTARSRSTT